MHGLLHAGFEAGLLLFCFVVGWFVFFVGAVGLICPKLSVLEVAQPAM